MASSCPNTTRFKSRSKLPSVLLSSLETVLGGMRAMRATISSISGTAITLLLSGNKR